MYKAAIDLPNVKLLARLGELEEFEVGDALSSAMPPHSSHSSSKEVKAW